MYHKERIYSFLFSTTIVLCFLVSCYAEKLDTSIISPHLYVAPNGDDSNPGTETKPFATLERARAAVRELKKTVREPITVFVRGGTYYLEEPLVFEPEDSGTDNQQITYASYRGEKPTINGGVKLDVKWEPYRDGIMKCSLPEVKEGKLNFTQLFINGKRQILARYPNYDSNNPLVTGDGYINAESGNKEDIEFHYNPETFTKKKWSKPAEAIVHIFQAWYWHNLMYRIKAINWERHVVELGEGGWQTNTVKGVAPNAIGKSSRFFIENVFEELDATGEWYLDKEEGILYYKPKEGMDLSNAKVEAVLLKRLIEFRGSRQHPVRYIQLKGFRFSHAATTFMDEYEIPSPGDWGIHRGGSVFLEGAEDCAVEECFFDAVGGNAVFISDHNRRIKIFGNKFTNIGESAICLVGKPNIDKTKEWKCPLCGERKSWDFGPDPKGYPAECQISNNLIHDIGVFGKQTAGVFMAMSMKNTISHNHIHHVPRAAVCINGPYWGGHIIEYNDIHDTVQETGDHGSFNSWGRGHCFHPDQNGIKVPHEPGDPEWDPRFTTIIRNNRFREDPFQASFISGDNNLGIDMDDNSAFYHVYNNLCIGVGVQNRTGAYHLTENNIFINPQDLMCYHIVFENNHYKLVRNILVISDKFDNFTDQWGDNFYQVLYPPARGPWFEQCDFNVFFNERGPFSAHVTFRGASAEEYSLEKWRELGMDRNSVLADPLFVDPANGDYRVKPESPALKLGFKNFDMGKFGLLPDFPNKWED